MNLQLLQGNTDERLGGSEIRTTTNLSVFQNYQPETDFQLALKQQAKLSSRLAACLENIAESRVVNGPGNRSYVANL